MKSVDEIDSLLQSAKTSEKDSSEQIVPPNDEIEDGFYLIDDSNHDEDLDFSDFPWLDPDHPLFFPATQANNSKGSTRWDAVNKFSVENWYPHLRKHTFKSHFITLNYNDIHYLMGNIPPDYDSSKLESIFNKILSEFNNKEVFMRLSTRSPKDSKFLFEEASSIMSKDFVYWNENDNKHQQLVSFVASMLKAMKIKSGRKIIETIAQSPRVYNDLLALVSSSNQSDCTTNVILREWHDIRPDHEFRVFVSRRHRKESIVTAISQYFHFLYFDKSPADCFNFLDEEDKKAVIKKFENYVLKSVDPDVAKFLNFSSEQDDDESSDCIREYIVDLALIPVSQYHGEITDENIIEIGANTYVMVVIELNPFAPAATGSGLFNWKNDLMMLWGKASCDYPVFKYRTTPREDLQSVSLLPSNYESVIKSALIKRLETSYSNSASQKERFFSSTKPVTESSGTALLDMVTKP
ncbi:TPA: lpg1684 family Dot/Icm T4SS effector [Legionella pneumophila]|nr:lpg1684 family Dot/Icm T4SS effector [Legionella pneumophila]HAT9740590.1 lpg1684 family Dot/Icm T4SS effector [Legionella pneumophila subsp. pneumophila]HAU1838939.1 lpg1684 family Dot/Icm T4SS effector [Legionella pneumophila]HBD9292419.1 lpg1684 family Dot/Icm T4SS effector [Legionella pneumophila]HDU8069622.1 lpg1684 family Dot/Icm T4SS effector [Legionella pneumophila]